MGGDDGTASLLLPNCRLVFHHLATSACVRCAGAETEGWDDGSGDCHVLDYPSALMVNEPLVGCQSLSYRHSVVPVPYRTLFCRLGLTDAATHVATAALVLGLGLVLALVDAVVGVDVVGCCRFFTFVKR